MMIDDDTLKQLLRIDDELMQLCKWLNKSAISKFRLGSYLWWTTSPTFCWRRVKTNCTEGRKDRTFRICRAAHYEAHIFFPCVFAHAYAASLHASYALSRQSGT
jgi:hypothetical protein